MSSVGSRLQAEYVAARSRTCPADQVINAPDALYPFPADSDAPAVATRAKWAAWQLGLPIPLMWEIPIDPFECECV